MKPLSAIYWLNSINSLAWSLFGVFVPVYLITLGYPLESIVYFYLLDSVTLFVFCVIASYLCTKIGLRKSMFFYLPFLLMLIGMLYFIKEFNIPLWVIAVTSGMQTALYFVPLNIIFARAANEKKMGSSVGKLMAYSQIASLAAPLIGGAVAVSGGFQLLFVGSALLFIFSGSFLFLISDADDRVEVDFRKVPAFFKKYPRYAIVQVFQFFQKTLEDVIWPVFVFLAFNNILSVGLVGSLLGAGSCFFMLFVGKRADNGSKRLLLKIGALMLAIIWLCRFFIHGQAAYYVFTVFAGFFGVLITIPFGAMAYNISKKGDIAEFNIFRELTILAGRVMSFGLVLMVVGRLDYTFIAAALSGLFFFLL